MNSQFDKNRKGGTLSGDEMKSYLDGKLGVTEMYDVEHSLEEDGFQAAAMEGYENNPGAIDDLDDLKAKFYHKLPTGKSRPGQRYGAYLSAAAAVLVLIASLAAFYYFQPATQPISENFEPTAKQIETAEEVKVLPPSEEEKEKKPTSLISKEKKEKPVGMDEKWVQAQKTKAPQQSVKKETLIKKNDPEAVSPNLAGEVVMDDEMQTVNPSSFAMNPAQPANLTAESNDLALPANETRHKSITAQDEKIMTSPNSANRISDGVPAMDYPARAQNETKVTYLLDLKVIDYTQIYERQIERTKMAYKPGTEAKYANQKDKTERAKIEEQVIDSVTYIDILHESLEGYKSGAYEGALHDFAIILRKHPEELNAKFYGGMAYFEMGNYVEALKNFDFVIEHPVSVFNPESEWYKAQTLVRLGELKKAKNLLEKIIQEKGFYAGKAKLLLGELR